MAVAEDFKLFVQDQLRDFGSITMKNMFGGYGIFKEGVMFGMLAGNKLRMRVDEGNKPTYEAAGMKPHESKAKKKGMPYWEVPEHVLDNTVILLEWAQKAYEAALRGKK